MFVCGGQRSAVKKCHVDEVNIGWVKRIASGGETFSRRFEIGFAVRASRCCQYFTSKSIIIDDSIMVHRLEKCIQDDPGESQCKKRPCFVVFEVVPVKYHCRNTKVF